MTTPILSERLDDDGKRCRDEKRRPSAWSMRAPTRISSDPETAHSTEATVNTIVPRANIRLRPNRSVSRPQTIRNEREDDVVRVEHPRQITDGRRREGVPDVREGDVHDGGVKEGEERAEGRDGKDTGRRRPGRLRLQDGSACSSSHQRSSLSSYPDGHPWWPMSAARRLTRKGLGAQSKDVTQSRPATLSHLPSWGRRHPRVLGSWSSKAADRWRWRSCLPRMTSRSMSCGSPVTFGSVFA